MFAEINKLVVIKFQMIISGVFMLIKITNLILSEVYLTQKTEICY